MQTPSQRMRINETVGLLTPAEKTLQATEGIRVRGDDRASQVPVRPSPQAQAARWFKFTHPPQGGVKQTESTSWKPTLQTKKSELVL